MNAIKLLETQHREVEALFNEIEGLGEKAGKDKKRIFSEIASKLNIHCKIEEKLFYPEGEEVDEETTLEAFEEHDTVKTLLKKISKTPPTDKSFMAKITVLKEMVEHHVKEEESHYFPECEKSFPSEKLEELGAELEAATEKLENKPNGKEVKRAKK